MNLELTDTKAISTIKKNSHREMNSKSKILNLTAHWRKQSFNQQQNKPDDIKKIISELNQQIETQKAKSLQLSNQLQEWKQRSVKKQIEFRQIIAKYEKQKIKYHTFGADNTYTIIHEKIEQTNEMCEKWIEKKYKQNLNLMDRRIYMLRKKMEEEIQKQKRLSLQSYQQIVVQIQFTKNIARSIDEQNKKLQKQIKQIRMKNQLLLQERNILLQEVIQQRRFNKKNVKKDARVITERLNTIKFARQPSISFANKGTSNSISINKKQTTISTRRQERSIQLLQKTLSREKKKNYELSKLFTKSSTKNKQINEMLLQCIEQSRKQLQKNTDKNFHERLLDNIIKSEKLVNNINEINEEANLSRINMKKILDINEMLLFQ